MRSVALRLALLFASATTASAQDACSTVPVDLRGPIDSVRLEALGVFSEVKPELAAGESRTVFVPFGGASVGSLEPSAAAAALRVTVEPAEGEAIVRAADAVTPGKLGHGIGRRGRPPVAPSRPRPDLARWLVLGGGACLLLGMRRRPRVAAGTGAFTALLIFVLPAAPLEGRSVRGIDGDAARDLWLEVNSAHERLEVRASRESWFETRGGTRAEWLVDRAGRWVLRAPGGEVHSLRRSDSTPLDPATGLPAFALRDVWARSADGNWSALLDWGPAEAFPPSPAPAGRAAGPTGWLAAGLPQGVSVLVATPVGPGAPDWLRITAFSALESDERR
jgi:hypothetical protein